MKHENQINFAVFNSIKETIKTPFMVLDQNGNIITFNDEASSLLEFDSSITNIYDVLSFQSAENFNEEFSEVLSQGNKLEKNIEIILKNGKSISTKVVINTFYDEDTSYLFCSFYPVENKLTIRGLTNINLVTEKLKEIFNNKDIVSIVQEIASSYPFTFLTKEKIRNKIDAFTEMIWVINKEGNYVLVNNKLSKSLGLKNSQLEGKSERDFILPHLIDFRIAVEDYIKKTTNSILLEGIPFKGIPNIDSFQLIEIPITDSENNAIAVVGVAQKKINKIFPGLKNGNQKDFNEVIYNLPKAFAVFDKKGIFITGSEKFYSLINLDLKPIAEINFKQIFHEDLSFKLEQFISSNLHEQSFNYKIQLDKNAVSSISESTTMWEDVKIFLSKIFDAEKQLEGVIMQIDETSLSDDFEALLNNKGKMFDLLIKDNPEPIFVYNKDDLMFLEVNNAALELYGYSKDEFLKMDLTDLYTTEDIQNLLDSNNQTKEGKFSKPFKHRKKDGSFVFVEISKMSFKFGEKDAHFNIIKDVTGRFELKQKQQQLHASFNNSDNPQFITDSTGFILEVNKKAIEVLNRNEEELINSSFTSLVEDENRGKINTGIFQANIKDAQSFICKLKNFRNELFETEIISVPILDFENEINSFNILLKLKAEKDTLTESEVESESVTLASKDLPEPDVSSASLSNIFHEILTPINVILGFTQEIMESIKNPTDEQKESIDIINHNKEVLMNSINTAAEYSKIKETVSNLKIEKISMPEVVDEIYNNFYSIIGTDVVDFAYGKISSSLTFNSDKENFIKLINLLVKTTTKIIGGNKLYLSASQFDDNNFLISFKDNYSSMSSHIADTLNNLFTTTNSSVRKKYGISKISLDLAKSLLQMLGGKFYLNEDEKKDSGFIFPLILNEVQENASPIVDSIEENDSEFSEGENKDYSFTSDLDVNIVTKETEKNENTLLDHSASKEQNILPSQSTEASFDNKKEEVVFTNYGTYNQEYNIDLPQLTCLYIEDQIDSQILYGLQMKDLKDIQYAVSFEEALPLLDKFSFDFILIDINILGEYNGLDALRMIHRLPGYEKLPIIAVTSYVLPGDSSKFIAAGFNDFISKPIFREKVIASLEKIFLMQM